MKKYITPKEVFLLAFGMGLITFAVYRPVGGFNQKQHIEIETILEKSECRTLLSFVQEIDENAFVTVSTVNEMVGAWNKNKKKLIP